MDDVTPRQTLADALAAGLSPYQICRCPKIENGAMAMVVGWSPDCLLHEGEEPNDGDGQPPQPDAKDDERPGGAA